jgi:hypothetical protein
MEGLRIPHFYGAFYVYKYATGISAALALAERVSSGGKKEREDYFAFLKSEVSRFPIESLKVAAWTCRVPNRWKPPARPSPASWASLRDSSSRRPMEGKRRATSRVSWPPTASANIHWTTITGISSWSW